MTPRPHVRSTTHDFEFMTGRCMRCGVTRSEAGDSKCTGRYKLVDAEVDGSIQRRMREIARGEGREPPEPGDGVALVSMAHPDGASDSDDKELNEAAIETIELELPEPGESANTAGYSLSRLVRRRDGPVVESLPYQEPSAELIRSMEWIVAAARGFF